MIELANLCFNLKVALDIILRHIFIKFFKLSFKMMDTLNCRKNTNLFKFKHSTTLAISLYSGDDDG